MALFSPRLKLAASGLLVAAELVLLRRLALELRLQLVEV